MAYGVKLEWGVGVGEHRKPKEGMSIVAVLSKCTMVLHDLLFLTVHDFLRQMSRL